MERFIPILGLIAFIAIAYSLSSYRNRIDWKLVAWGLLLQFSLCIIILGVPSLGIPGPARFIFEWTNVAVNGVLDYTLEGSKFLFGDLVDTSKSGFIVAFQVLPTIIFMAALMSVLYHLKIMQIAIFGTAWLMQRTMKTSGAETLSSAANIFVGQTEAPLVVKPFLKSMTRSELLTVMVGGMATVAGGVLAAYVGLLRERIPDIAGHLLTASVLSAPAAILFSKILIPETKTPETKGTIKVTDKSALHPHTNVIDAAASGATEGLSLALNVAAMLLVFIAIVALCNGLLSGFGDLIGFSNWGSSLALNGSDGRLTFQLILGWLFAPLAWLMGIPSHDIAVAGSLLGEKVVLNEFYAYVHLSEISTALSDRSVVILSYALCGFANFSSIGIQIGGIGGLAPERRPDLAELGMRAVVGGSLACFSTACVVSFFI